MKGFGKKMKPRYDVNDIGKFFDLDITVRALKLYNKSLQLYEEIRCERNTINKEIGERVRAGEDVTELKKQATVLKENYENYEKQVEDNKRRLIEYATWLAEVPHPRYLTENEIKEVRQKYEEEGGDFKTLVNEKLHEKWLRKRLVKEYPAGKLHDHKSAVIVDLAVEELKYVRKILKEKEEWE